MVVPNTNLVTAVYCFSDRMYSEIRGKW